MTAYIFRRFMIAVLLAFTASTVIFLTLRVVPGDVVDAMFADAGLAPEQRSAIRHSMGLDQPVPVQYVSWLQHLGRGDLGTSYVSGRPVALELTQTFPRTLELIVGATLLAWLIGVPAGIFASTRRNSASDLLVSFGALLGLSVPVFVTASMLILVFSIELRWLPASGFVPFREEPVQHLRMLLLPTLTVAIAFSGFLMRMTRGSLLEVLQQDFIRTARGKGLRDRMVLYRHAFRNALLPVVTTSGLQVGQLLGGTVIVEYVFNYPGLSTLLISAVHRRDYPVVQGALMLISVTFILINLGIDILNGYLDPRIRYR